MAAPETPTPTPPPVLMNSVQTFLKEQSPELKKQLDTVNALIEHPMTKLGTTLMQDHEFTASVTRIAESHSGTQFAVYEGVLIVALWIFRAWRLTKSNTLLARLWTQAWIGVLFWILALTAVPALVWGEAFRTAFGHLIRVVLRQFLA